MEKLHFEYREEAMRWICLHQVGRRNVSPELLRYQIGKRYNVEKIMSAHNPKGRNQYSEVASDVIMRPPAEKRMGKPEELGFAIATVADERNGYLAGVDVLVDGGSVIGKAFVK